MKFGVREICDVVFKALQPGNFGTVSVVKGQPVLYIEGAASTVYATGGRGNSRLIAWEGEKTLTFTVEDALLSPIGFAMLSGAGLFNPDENKKAYIHTTAIADVVSDTSSATATVILAGTETFATDAPLFVMEYKDGSIGNILKPSQIQTGTTADASSSTLTLTLASGTTATQVFVDFYVLKSEGVTELTIDAENFAGYYYVEASTLFRRESDGKDLPAEIVFPKVKIQSNFTFSMSSTGDPSSFTFTMDALPAYTMFNNKKKALCAIQIIEDEVTTKGSNAVTLAANCVATDIAGNDSGAFPTTTE